MSLQVMNPPEAQKSPVVMQMRAELSIRYEVYLLYWYISPCFTGTKVQRW